MDTTATTTTTIPADYEKVASLAVVWLCAVVVLDVLVGGRVLDAVLGRSSEQAAQSVRPGRKAVS